MRQALARFNRGRVSDLGLARTDVERVSMSAAVQTNWMPRVLGSMSLRPGLKYHGTANKGVYIPFVYSGSDTAILEAGEGTLRFWDNGDTLVSMPTVTAAVQNGGFPSDLDHWTDNDETGTASSWHSDGYMQLLGTEHAAARRRQQVTVNEPGIRHALRIIIERGPVILRVGSLEGLDNIVRKATLGTGEHHISFTPGGDDFHIELSGRRSFPVLVDSCKVGEAGTVEIPTSWLTQDKVRELRWSQVNDVIFLAVDGQVPRKIERRASDSWSLVEYEPEDGPFLLESVDGVTLTPSGTTGEITIAASQRVFTEDNVGSLLRITSAGQTIANSFSSDASFSDPIRVVDVSKRSVTIERSGTWVGSVSLQRSMGQPGAWVTVREYDGNGTTEYDDELENAVAYYRVGIEAGNYTSGTAKVTLSHSSGSLVGVAKITGFTGSKNVDAIVLSQLGSTDATEIWAEGAWSERRGFPTAVASYEGRMWWAGRGRIWGSISDAFYSFDPDYEGDAGPIDRWVGDGPVDIVNWLLPSQRLLVGTDASEMSIRASSLEEPVTPSNYNVKVAGSSGSTGVPACLIDAQGVFIGRSGTKVLDISYDIQRADYTPNDLTKIMPEIGEPGIVRMAVQRHPDTRIHCVRSDGTVAVLVRDPAEEVSAWIDIETDGNIEDVCVLPGDTEDRVFYLVRREIKGVAYRYHEEWAKEADCRGGDLNRQADSFVEYNGEATTEIDGLSHLLQKTVVVWADGDYVGEFYVTGTPNAKITLPAAVSKAIVGLPYSALYRSSKSALQTQGGTGLTQRGRVIKLGLILAHTHIDSLEYGRNFAEMDPLGRYMQGEKPSGVFEAGEVPPESFKGEWDTDPRVCLRAMAPKPCTVLAAIVDMDRRDAP